MKIISGYKDYYDYLKGIYGEDPKIILDRRVFENKEFFSHRPEDVQLFICGKIIEGFWDGEEFYYGESLSKFGKIEKPRSSFFSHTQSSDSRYVYFESEGKSLSSIRNRHTINVDIVDDKKNYNLKENCPILLNNVYIKDGFYKFPILSKLNFSSVIKPEEIYQMLVKWYSDRNSDLENRTDTRTDVEKLLSKGFDKKESFRPKIKTS
jgi:hypothetical protein